MAKDDDKVNANTACGGLAVFFFFLGLIIGMAVWYDTYKTEVVLGNAICSETTGTEYYQYSDGVVECTAPKVEKQEQYINYDGLKVKQLENE